MLWCFSSGQTFIGTNPNMNNLLHFLGNTSLEVDVKDFLENFCRTLFTKHTVRMGIESSGGFRPRPVRPEHRAANF